MDPGTIIALVIAGLFIIIVVSGVRIVPQAQVMMIERLGRFHRTAVSGLNFIIPFVDRGRRFFSDQGFRSTIDLREQVMDFPPQPVITKDNVTLQVDSVIYFRITEPLKALYEVENLPIAIRQLAVTNMRNVMGELDLDQTLSSRETVNAKLQSVLDEATDVWGVKVTRVELKNINPPREIEVAMAKQMKAERERRAVVTEAEGEKSSAILRAEGLRDAAIAAAEGDRQKQILEASGQAEAIISVAKAEATAIELRFAAIHAGNASQEVIAIQYLDTLKEMSKGDANKIFLPYEASGILAAVAGVAEAAGTKKRS